VKITFSNSNGDLLWNDTWGSDKKDEGYAIKLFNNNVLYVCGNTDKSPSMNYDFLLIKFKLNTFIATTPVIPGFNIIYLLIRVIIIIYLKLSRKIKLII